MKSKIFLWLGICSILVGICFFLFGTTFGLSFISKVKSPLIAIIVIIGSLCIGLTIIIDMIYKNIRIKKIKQMQLREVNNYIHDRVLQTITTIQNTADDAKTVRKLARNLELELREWISGKNTKVDESISKQLEMIIRSVEEEFDESIEYVSTGDISPNILGDDKTRAILNACTQALINALSHGKPPYNVMLSAKQSKIEIFIRDHGDGFDIKSIPDLHYGVKESIIQRIKDVGGEVKIRSEIKTDNLADIDTKNFGTEVSICIKL